MITIKPPAGVIREGIMPSLPQLNVVAMPTIPGKVSRPCPILKPSVAGNVGVNFGS